MNLNHSNLHHAIIDTVTKRGYAPTVAELSHRFATGDAEVRHALRELQDYHGVVLHPKSDEVWIVHPFSMAPTGFLVRAGQLEWWGNCAWCSLGIAALAGGTATITTLLAHSGRPVSIRIEDNKLMEGDFVIHFPVRMICAWDNVHYTCSMMLAFESEEQVDLWCAKHGKPKGDVRPIEQIWQFSREWYGRHADPDWQKWTNEQAAEIFSRHGLTGPIWKLPIGQDRF